MFQRFKVELPADFMLEPLDIVVLKLNNLSAFHADQVIVVLMAEYMFIGDLPLTPDRLLDHPAFDKQRYQPVDGGERNPFSSFFQTIIENFDAEVLMEFKNFLKNDLPLRSKL